MYTARQVCVVSTILYVKFKFSIKFISNKLKNENTHETQIKICSYALLRQRDTNVLVIHSLSKIKNEKINRIQY